MNFLVVYSLQEMEFLSKEMALAITIQFFYSCMLRYKIERKDRMKKMSRESKTIGKSCILFLLQFRLIYSLTNIKIKNLKACMFLIK